MLAMLFEPRGDPFEIPQHPFIKIRFDEIGYALEAPARIAHQFLVVHFQIMRAVSSLLSCRLHSIAPIGRQGCHIVARRKPLPPQAKSGVAAVPKQMDEPGFRKQAANGGDVGAVERRLISPSSLAVFLRIQRIETTRCLGGAWLRAKPSAEG